jgi:hypothetical protein
VKQVEEKAHFDFKQAGLKSLEFVQNGLDGVLAGTTIQRKGSPEIVLSSATPVVLRLQLVSPEPLNSQTISVLGSQLASKLGLPIQLHGEIELRSASYQLALAPAKPSLGLTAEERAAVTKLIHQIQQDNLRLQVTYASDESAGDHRIPRFVAEIRGLLSRSRLKSSQWTLEVEPLSASPSTPGDETALAPTGTGKEKHEAVAPDHLRCKLRAFQDF